MIDRVVLLSKLPNRAHLPATTERQFHELLDEAISMALEEVDLQDVRGLSNQDRDEIEAALRDILELTSLKKVARKWEPQRKLEAGVSGNHIADTLVELLHGQREPYALCSLTLTEARALGAKERHALKHSIEQLTPVADLKKLAKLWDKQNRDLAAKSVQRQELAAALLDLLAGTTEPVPPPAKTKRSQKK
jgi:hypothetical protein